MICNRCGTQSENSARICPRCGAPLSAYNGTEGVNGIRQGRTHEPPPVYGEETERMPRMERYAHDAGRPSNRRGVRGEGDEAREMQKPRRHGAAPRAVARRGVNRALLLTVTAGVLLVAAIALFVLAIRLPQGHLILMRAVNGNADRQESVISLLGEENAAKAMWQIGDEQLDQGYVAQAIETYREAFELNPEIEGLYDRLMRLADAYEAVGALEDAEEVYRQLYTDVDATKPQAYRYTIALMMDQGRLFEAVALMQTAYEKTGELSFKSQREQRVPLAPTSTLSAGRHMLEQVTSLESPQGYDVYYLLDDETSELPENGILFTEPIQLTEGAHVLRAVCVSTELVSDEVNLKYTIYYPTPSAPKSRLLTGEYDKRRRIYLYMEEIRDGKKVDTPNQDYTIYYTVDGTAPTLDSPVYTDEGFLLPAGPSTVRAVAVNQYNKVSNEYVGTYKVNVAFKNFFRDTNDQFKSFAVGTTDYEAFKKLFGSGREETVTTEDTRSGQGLKVSYEWGEAYFTVGKKTLYSVTTNYASSMTGPRNTKVGMGLDEVTAQFRDMGQAANAKGNRSLYYDENVGYGRYWKDSDTEGHLEYVYRREDGGVTTLTYMLKNNAVTRITMTVSGMEIE